MMITKKMPSFEGVAAGETGTCRLPIGLTYHQLLIEYTGVTLAQIKGIRVIADGLTFQRYTSAQVLDMMNQFNGRAAANGVLVIDFTRYGLRTRAGEEVTALGTGVSSSETGKRELSTLSIEVDIDAAASAPKLTCKAVQSAARPLGFVRYVREYGYTAQGVGEFEISDIPKGHLFSKLHFMNADVKSLKVKRDDFIAFERSKAENTLIQKDGARVPQAGVFTFDPSEIGNGGETLETAGVHDLRFVCDMNAAGDVPVVVESIAPLAL